MLIQDRKNNIMVNVMEKECLIRPCYTPQISFHNENIGYVCVRREIYGCPAMYIGNNWKLEKQKGEDNE